MQSLDANTQDVDEYSQKIASNVCCVNWASQTLTDTDGLHWCQYLVDDLGFTTFGECNL